MAARSVEFHPKAIVEAREAGKWYSAKAGRLAARKFEQELDGAVKRIAESPERWPQYRRGTRRYLLQRFPYAVIYRLSGTSVQILAIAHARRRPEFWKQR